MFLKSKLLMFIMFITVFLVGCGQDSEVYQGSSMGYNGTIQVELELVGEKINAIQVLSHSDTTNIAEPAFEQLAAAVIERQDTDVDVVSGATYSSRGFLLAVENALETASGIVSGEGSADDEVSLHADTFADGRYRGAFGDRGYQQVVIQFHLTDGVFHNLSYRHLYHAENDYRQMDEQHELYPVKVQHEQVLDYLDGKAIATIEELRAPGDFVEDIDGYSGATIRGSKLYSAIRDALNRGVYTPADEINRTIRDYADGRYRGTFGDRGDQQVSIQFELQNNTFGNVRYRHLYYGGTDYRQLDSDADLYPVVTQHEQIADYLEGKPLSAVFDLYNPANVIDDVDGFSGATVRANKVLSAIMNALSRNVYVPADISAIDLGSHADGRYRGIYEDAGVQQVSVQFYVEDGSIVNPSFRHLYYKGDDYRRLEAGDALYPVLQQHDEILAYLDGKPLNTVIDLHNPGDFVSDIDGFTGATIRGNKVFSAIIDGLNRGLY